MRKIALISMFLVLFSMFFLACMNSRVRAEGKSEYTGAEACKGCHEDYYNSYSSSIHAKKNIPGSPAKQNACESCHGTPHPSGMLAQFPKCNMCHISAHSLGKEANK